MGFPILLLLAALGYSVRSRIERVTLHRAVRARRALADPADRALQLVLPGADRARDRPAAAAGRTSSRRRAWSARRRRGSSARTSSRTSSARSPSTSRSSAPRTSSSSRRSRSSTSASRCRIASWGNMLATNWGHFFIVDQPGFSSGDHHVGLDDGLPGRGDRADGALPRADRRGRARGVRPGLAGRRRCGCELHRPARPLGARDRLRADLDHVRAVLAAAGRAVARDPLRPEPDEGADRRRRTTSSASTGPSSSSTASSSGESSATAASGATTTGTSL